MHSLCNGMIIFYRPNYVSGFSIFMRNKGFLRAVVENQLWITCRVVFVG